MKKLLLVLVSIVSCSFVNSQDCKDYLKQNINNYTDSKMIESIWIEAAKNQAYLKFNLRKRKLEIDYSSNSQKISEKNDTLLFNFDNGKQIQLIAPRKGRDIFTYTDAISTKYQNTYLGNLNILDYLSTYKLLFIKEKRTGLIITLSTKATETLNIGARCFYSQIDTIKDIQPYYLERNNNDCDFFDYKVDKFTGELQKRMAYTTIGFKAQSNDYNSFALVGSLFKFGPTLSIDIRLNSSSYCIDDNSYIMIKLDNDQIVKVKNSSGIDCGEGRVFKCFPNEDDIVNLLKSQIKVVRLMTAEGYIDIENITYPQYFIDQLKCLKID